MSMSAEIGRKNSSCLPIALSSMMMKKPLSDPSWLFYSAATVPKIDKKTYNKL